MMAEIPFKCPGCAKQCRIVYEQPSGATQAVHTVGVRHGCGTEIARAVGNRKLEFYEMGEDGQFHRSENVKIDDF